MAKPVDLCWFQALFSHFFLHLSLDEALLLAETLSFRILPLAACMRFGLRFFLLVLPPLLSVQFYKMKMHGCNDDINVSVTKHFFLHRDHLANI